MLSSRMPDFNPVDSSIGTMDVDNVPRSDEHSNNDSTVPKVSTASTGDPIPSIFTDNIVTESMPSNNNTHVVSSSSSYVRSSNGDVDYRRTDSTHSRNKDSTRSTSSRYSSSGHHHRRGSRSRSPRSRSPRSRSRSSQSDSEESSDSESSPSRFSSRKSRFRSHDHRASNHQSGGQARNDDSSTSMHPPSSSYHHRSSNRHSGTSGTSSSRFGGKDRAHHDSSSGYRSNRPRRDSYSGGHHHHKPYHRSTSKQSSNNTTSSSSGLIPVRYAERGGRNHRRPSANNVITPTLDATSPYFVEPYNPESATTIDPSMLMQMLPGFLQLSPQQTPAPSIPFALGRYVLQPNNNASTSITKEISQDSTTNESPMENNPIGVVPSSYQSLKMLKKFNQSVMPCLGMGGLLLPPAMMQPPVTRPRELVGVNISGSEPYVPKQVRRGRGRGGNNFGGNTGGFSGTRRPKRQDDELDQTQQTSARVGNPANDPKVLYDRSYLMLRKIPPEMNSISMLDQHFSKFGTVLNIEVCHQNDPECALVQFSCANEALAALHSTEAVFNNRFIKMFLARNDFGKNGAPQRVIHNRNQANLTVTVTANDNATLGDQQMDSQQAETQHKMLSPQKPGSIFDRLGIQKNSVEGQEAVATAVVPQFKTMARAEYAAKRKELADRSKSLQETMANQKHLMGKLEAAKTPKEKTAILKLLQLNMANVKELQEACKKIQDSFKGVLQTTKVNNNRIVIAPGARSALYPSSVATTQDVQRRPSLQDTTTTKSTEEEEEEAMNSDDGDEVEPSTPTSTNETETTNNKLLSFAASLTDF